MTRPLNAGSLARVRAVAALRSVDCVSVFTGDEYRKVARALFAKSDESLSVLLDAAYARSKQRCL
jgi:hypothetical protein